MGQLRAPILGPIVGHTGDRFCRLWIRATDPLDQGTELAAERRTVGVLAVTRVAGEQISQSPVCYFRLHREYDRTGTFLLGCDKGLDSSLKPFELQPDTDYEVRLGTLSIIDSNALQACTNAELLALLPPAQSWWTELQQLPAEKAVAKFRTFPVAGAPTANIGFVLGSCRYPGFLWRVRHSDRIFAAIHEMQQNSDNKQPLHFAIMLGDQIYADRLYRRIPVGRADTFEEFQQRYHQAFGSPNMRQLLRHLPTYMILDDHEIEDNWTQDRLTQGKRALFNLAINAYMSYQWVHGPRNFPQRLYYTFACGGYPFFVLDTRTQRYMDDAQDALEDNHLLGRPALAPGERNQLDRLLNWLTTQQQQCGNVPKFIVSASVFVPNAMNARAQASRRRKENSDSWPAFPTTRRAILDCIVAHQIQNVVFLSGDIHCSLVAQMYFSGSQQAAALKAFGITSSAFYWPFPFADGDPANYVHDSRAPGQEDAFVMGGGVTMDYKAWNFTQQDNFCWVKIDRENATITVRAFDTKGQLIHEPQGEAPSEQHKIETQLNLEPW